MGAYDNMTAANAAASGAASAWNPWVMGATILGGLFGGGQEQQQDPRLGWYKYWKQVAKGGKEPTGPLGDVFGYWRNIFQNPFGDEFQTAWKQYQDESSRRYGTMSNNLAYQVAQRMGTSDSSTMPGLLGYLTRMQGIN